MMDCLSLGSSPPSSIYLTDVAGDHDTACAFYVLVQLDPLHAVHADAFRSHAVEALQNVHGGGGGSESCG